MLSEVIQRNDARRRTRRTAGRAHVRTATAWRDGYELDVSLVTYVKLAGGLDPVW